MLHKVVGKVIREYKQETLDKLKNAPRSSKRLEMSLDEVEIEIDVNFFRETLLPAVHKIMSCNIKTDSSSLFNLVFALQLGLSSQDIEEKEMQYILNQFVSLKEFWKWRSPNHEFVNMQDSIDPSQMISLNSELRKLYPDTSRQVFDYIENNLGKKFTFAEGSMFFQK